MAGYLRRAGGKVFRKVGGIRVSQIAGPLMIAEGPAPGGGRSEGLRRLSSHFDPRAPLICAPDRIARKRGPPWERRFGDRASASRRWGLGVALDSSVSAKPELRSKQRWLSKRAPAEWPEQGSRTYGRPRGMTALCLSAHDSLTIQMAVA